MNSVLLNDYYFTRREGIVSLCTLTAYAYAIRHWEASFVCNPSSIWPHRLMAAVECIPLVGPLFALAESISLLVQKKFFSPQPWQPRIFTPETALEKMWKNAQKALREHEQEARAYVSSSCREALPPLEQFKAPHNSPLSYIYYVSAEKGKRKDMEDFFLVIERESGILAAVLDGHGGIDAAEYAKKAIEERFFPLLEAKKKNVHTTFECLFDELQKGASKMSSGTTVVISFLERWTHKVYTATLGDSEANLYRIIDRKMRSISLSCIRNWSSPKDRARAKWNIPTIETSWETQKGGAGGAKALRYPPRGQGLNLSRSLGDANFKKNDRTVTAISSKPKITVTLAKRGDTLLLVSDGVKDYFNENRVVSALQYPDPQRNTACRIVDLALHDSQDNITVVAVKIT